MKTRPKTVGSVLFTYDNLVGDNTERERCELIHHWFFYQQGGTPTGAKKPNSVLSVGATVEKSSKADCVMFSHAIRKCAITCSLDFKLWSIYLQSVFDRRLQTLLDRQPTKEIFCLDV